VADTGESDRRAIGECSQCTPFPADEVHGFAEP
jgi:hypothetical protein